MKNILPKGWYGFWIVDAINAPDFDSHIEIWKQQCNKFGFDIGDGSLLDFMPCYNFAIALFSTAFPFAIAHFLYVCSRPFQWLQWRLWRLWNIRMLWESEHSPDRIHPPQRGLIKLILDSH